MRFYIIYHMVFEVTQSSSYYYLGLCNNVFPLICYIHNIFLIKCSPVSSFRQFVYHVLSFSTVEFGIQFLISCILSRCHCFLSIRFVFSEVSQVFCFSTALPLLENISLFLYCFLHIIIPPPGLPFYILATRCFS